jgi:hypothetical protein
MANLTGTLAQLRNERRQAQLQVEKLDEAILVIEKLLGQRGKRTAGTGVRRVLSPAAKRRISQAQKARWAKFRAQRKAAA